MRRALLLCALLVGAAHAQPVFKLAVSQGGIERAITDHAVRLERAPFALVVYFEEAGESVLVKSAVTPKWLDHTAKGASPEVIFEGQTGLAEGVLNPERELFIRDAPQYLYFQAEGDHRFDEVKRLPDGRIRCVRTIHKLNFESGVKPIQAYGGEALYLSLLSTQWKPDYSGQLVRQRDWLTITFPTPPKGAPVAAPAP